MASVMFYKAIEISCIIYYVHGNSLTKGQYFCLQVNDKVAVYFKTNKTAQNNVLSTLRTTQNEERENINNKYDFRTVLEGLKALPDEILSLNLSIPRNSIGS